MNPNRIAYRLSTVGLLFLICGGIGLRESLAGEIGTVTPGAPSAIRSTASPEPSISAYRDPTKSWKEYADAAMGAALARTTAAVPTVFDSRVAVANVNLSKVPVWSDADIWEQFRATRDARFLLGDTGFLRRSPWLDPRGGCWIRAELVALGAADAGKPRPYKLFAFGDLTVQTPNSPTGEVSWWFHVVPIVKSASSGEAFVLDPAIDPTRPLPWKTWLRRMVPALTDVEVTIADPGAYFPFYLVAGEPRPSREGIENEARQYLSGEWSWQADLGRDPITSLGYFPPWANVGADFNLNRKPDLLWRNVRTGVTRVWYMNGSTRTATADLAIKVTDSSWKIAATGDFDRDGKTDIVWHQGSTGTTRIWYMDGVSRTRSRDLTDKLPLSSGWKLVGAADFNADQRPDILWHNGTTGETKIWYLNNALERVSIGNLDSRYPVADNSGWTFAGTGDFSRDGNMDVIWRNEAQGATRIWHLDKNVSVIFASNLPSTPSGWRLLSVQDFDQDGNMDIAWHQGDTGRTEIWYMADSILLRTETLSNTIKESDGWVGVSY